MESKTDCYSKLNLILTSSWRRDELPVTLLLSAKSVDLRYCAVRWINATIDKIKDFEARDTAVQILDRFLNACIEEKHSQLENQQFILLAASVSVLVATKMHDSQRFYGRIFNTFFLMFRM